MDLLSSIEESGLRKGQERSVTIYIIKADDEKPRIELKIKVVTGDRTSDHDAHEDPESPAEIDGEHVAVLFVTDGKVHFKSTLRYITEICHGGSLWKPF